VKKRYVSSAFERADKSAAERIAVRMEELRAKIVRNRQRAIAAGAGQDVTQLPDTPRQRRRHWAALAAAQRPAAEVDRRIASFMADDASDKTEQMIGLGQAFLRAAERGDAARIAAYLASGFPADYQDPATGETALHIAAGVRARDVLRVLLSATENDFLIRDNQGRLPSEIAYCFGDDPAAARLLGRKEKLQARRDGITLTRRA
jgi:ankyrin repeat protein